MLDLDDEQWAGLRCCYGDGAMVASWLRELSSATSFSQAQRIFWQDVDVSGYRCPVLDLLYHQGGVYPATYAAIPHLVEYSRRIPLPKELKFRVDVLGSVGFWAGEALICRPAPKNLARAYRAALKEAHRLVAETMAHTDDETMLQILCESLAGITGNQDLFDHIHRFEQDPICPECGEILVCPDCSEEDEDDE